MRPTRLAQILLFAILTAAVAILWSAVRADGEPVPLAEAPTAAPRDTSATSQQASGAPNRTTARETAQGCYSAAAGTAFRYDLDDRTEFQLTSQEGGMAQSGALHTQATVTTTVLARRSDEVLVRCELANVKFLAADGGDAPDDDVARAFRAAAATPVLAHLRDDGTPLGFGFATHLDGDQRNFLRGTLLLLLAVAPADAATEWDGIGGDTTGEFRAHYRRVAAAEGEIAVQREKQRYLVMAGNAELPEHTVRGQALARFSLAVGWLCAVSVDEHLTTALPLLDLRAITHRRAEATLVASETVVVSAEETSSWDQTTAPASGLGETLGGHAVSAERELWHERLQGQDLATLLTELHALLGKEPLDSQALEQLETLFQKLQWLVRLDGKVAGEIGERIAAGALVGTAAATALAALGAAGTDAAQAVLAAVRSDRSLPFDVREAATVSLLQLPAPSRELVAGLAADATVDFDGRDGAMLVLGALANRTAPLADGRTAAQALLALEGDAARRGGLPTWLLAVGNMADANTRAVALRYLDHGDAQVRGAALTALRRVADPDVVRLLAGRGFADHDPFVRQEAARALGHRTEANAAEALRQLAANDGDAETRRTALRELARASAPGSDNRAAIERAAAADLDEAVRAFARELLGRG